MCLFDFQTFLNLLLFFAIYRFFYTPDLFLQVLFVFINVDKLTKLSVNLELLCNHHFSLFAEYFFFANLKKFKIIKIHNKMFLTNLQFSSFKFYLLWIYWHFAHWLLHDRILINVCLIFFPNLIQKFCKVRIIFSALLCKGRKISRNQQLCSSITGLSL